MEHKFQHCYWLSAYLQFVSRGTSDPRSPRLRYTFVLKSQNITALLEFYFFAIECSNSCNAFTQSTPPRSSRTFHLATAPKFLFQWFRNTCSYSRFQHSTCSASDASLTDEHLPEHPKAFASARAHSSVSDASTPFFVPGHKGLQRVRRMCSNKEHHWLLFILTFFSTSQSRSVKDAGGVVLMFGWCVAVLADKAASENVNAHLWRKGAAMKSSHLMFQLSFTRA